MKLTVFSSFAVALLAVAFLSPVAHAQSAEVLLQQGLDMRRQQRDAEALQHFQDAYQLNQSAQALAQIALAEQALGSYVDAEAHLQQALAVQGDIWIDGRRAQLSQALGQISAQLGTVELSGGIPGAQVLVNGVERGTFPQAASLRIRAGSAVIEIRAQGYLPVQRTVVVMAGGIARESIQLIATQGQGQVAVQPQGYGVQAQGGYVVQPQGGYYQQPQTRYEEQPNLRLFWAGLPIFLAPWVLTWTVTYAIDGGRTDDTTFGFIPWVGPFLLIDSVNEDISTTMLVISGLAQIAGTALMVLGLATTREVEVRASLGDAPDAPVLAFTPMAGSDFVGGALTLTHY